MDLHLKQWNQQQQQQEDESEGRQHQQQQQQPSAKFPKLLLQPRPQQLPPSNHNTTNNNRNSMKDHPPLPLSSAGSTLPLFVPDHPDPHQPTNRSSSSSSSSSSPMIEMGSYFSFVQWQELELQALIYRYMLSGIPVPPELLHLIKRNLSHPSPSTSFLQQNHPHLSYFLHHPQSQPFRFQSGYWGRASMDPEPGRCRRTDGKKWRCSRDVVPGQKYCERHVHRGRNRSRKPVEISPTNSSQDIVPGGNLTSSTFSVTVASIGSVTAGNHFAMSGSGPPIDLFQTNKSHSNFRARTEPGGGQVLRHFFDDWPRTLQEPEVGSLTGLSMSIGSNPSSDVSLKLSTGDDESDRVRGSNWLTSWSSPSGTASAGGPLAEALRSSATTTDYSSPTSVLHRLTCGLAAETGLVTQV